MKKFFGWTLSLVGLFFLSAIVVATVTDDDFRHDVFGTSFEDTWVTTGSTICRFTGWTNPDDAEFVAQIVVQAVDKLEKMDDDLQKEKMISTALQGQLDRTEANLLQVQQERDALQSGLDMAKAQLAKAQAELNKPLRDRVVDSVMFWK